MTEPAWKRKRETSPERAFATPNPVTRKSPQKVVNNVVNETCFLNHSETLIVNNGIELLYVCREHLFMILLGHIIKLLIFITLAEV
jgi:hypothetical protein